MIIAGYAGICSAFGFLLWQSIVMYFSMPGAEIFDLTLAMAIVALCVVLFIEPLTEPLKRLLGYPEGNVDPRGNRLMLLAGGLLIVLIASVSHGLLSSLIERDSSGAFGIIAGATVLPGGITYAWLRGGRRRPRRAALSGLAAGGALGICFGFATIFVFVDHHAVSLNNAEIELMKYFFPWPLFGLVGGIAIDKGWGRSRSHSVAIAVVGSAVALVMIQDDAWTMGALGDLAKIFGWMTGLLIQRTAVDRCLGMEGYGLATANE